MNTIEAKRIRIVDYLRLLGHEPVKVRGGQYWYLSPLRKEDTPVLHPKSWTLLGCFL